MIHLISLVIFKVSVLELSRNELLSIKWKGTRNTSPKPNTHLREVEQSWFTEKYVSQINSPTGQHLDLVFTEMMTSQKLTKVPAGRATICY